MNSNKTEKFDSEKEYDSKWLSTKELENTYICANADVIRDLLYKFQSDMPKYIQVRNVGNRRDLCLFGNPLVIRSFCVMAKLQQPTKPQVNEWLTIGEMSKKFNCSPADLLNVLQGFQNNMPKGVNPQMIFAIRNDATVLDALRKSLDVVSMSPAVATASVPSAVPNVPVPVANEKTFNADDWISVSGLIRKKLAHGSAEKISSGLKKWRETNPDDIFEKIFRGNTILYLRNNPAVIQRFNEAQESKKPKQKPKQNTKEGWLSLAVLFKRKIVNGAYKKAENALKNWQVNNPDDILTKPRGDSFSYYLRDDADVIKRFSDSLNRKDWISCTELAKRKVICVSVPKMSDVLQEYQKNNPDDVQERTVKGKTSLHLRNTPAVIQRFGEFAKSQSLEQKTTKNLSEQWLGASDLEYKYIDAGFSSISDKLYVLQPSMPDLIQTKDTSCGQKLCLKRAAIPAFCAKTGFCAITEKTSAWLSVSDLIKHNYVPGMYKNIKSVLLLNKPYKRDYVQMKIGAKGKLSLCLLNNADAIRWFRKKMGVSPMLFRDEAKKWILVDDLPEKYIMAPVDKIKLKLAEFSEFLRDETWTTQSRGRSVIYLRRDAIGRFCQMAGLKTATEIAATMTQTAELVDFARTQSKQKS